MTSTKGMTKAERHGWRLDNLPIFAKDEIAKRDRRIQELEATLAEMRNAERKSGYGICVDYVGALDGMPLPTERVRFLSDENGRNGITVYEERGMLMVHADDGLLKLRPNAGNEIFVSAIGWGE